MPCGLRICLLWLIVILMGSVSPGSAPARRTSAVAVIVLSDADVATLRISLLRFPVPFTELGSLTTWKL